MSKEQDGIFRYELDEEGDIKEDDDEYYTTTKLFILLKSSLKFGISGFLWGLIAFIPITLFDLNASWAVLFNTSLGLPYDLAISVGLVLFALHFVITGLGLLVGFAEITTK